MDQSKLASRMAYRSRKLFSGDILIPMLFIASLFMFSTFLFTLTNYTEASQDNVLSTNNKETILGATTSNSDIESKSYNKGINTNQWAQLKTTKQTTITICEFKNINEQFLCLVNNYRLQQNLAPLTLDSNLKKTAREHTTWMANKQTLSHTNQQGESYEERCISYSTNCKYELIAQLDNTSAETLFNYWKNDSYQSNAHLLGKYKSIGLGISENYASLLFN